ncbi:pimeloyl-ACP methyl ester carboxylesterase [Geodermatophilus bullaregiensis]|uniref:alpha/beta fold hydrolase n=1 Tax=Geodermatophilus bullaregiensis TaxID=1564160 RepID=UPI00195E5CB1|nr:alpha/beta fold hydrolase [Geodermatophilus bullaregiensis]MBM7806188.1 pimeloyl-ACP methyl ester carboxylesterase [Geodermatophilus bullaregiensis]
MTTEFVESTDGTRIALERVGAGPVLVLVDGAAMYRAFGTSRALAQRLASSFTVVAYDRRGRGESTDTPPWALEREVDDLTAVLAHATGDAAGRPAAVHTLSSGAVLALHAVAAGAPIRALSMFEPPLDLDGDPTADAAQIDELAQLVRSGRRREAVQAFHRGIGMPPEMIAAQPETVLEVLDGIAPTLVYDMSLSRTGAVSEDLLAAVRVPAQVLSSDTGSGPLGGWAARVAAALPHGEHRTLPGSWHGVPDDVLAEAIRGFAAPLLASAP